MVTRLAQTAPMLPLLTWPEQVEATALAEQRAALVIRMKKLPHFSHRRIALAIRLRELTERQLRLEAQIEGRRRS